MLAGGLRGQVGKARVCGEVTWRGHRTARLCSCDCDGRLSGWHQADRSTLEVETFDDMHLLLVPHLVV